MENHPTDEEIFVRLSEIIVQALRIHSQRIKAESRILADLGAESLDLLDIRFRIERTFGFKIEQDEIIRALGKDLSIAEIREKLTIRSLIDFIRNRTGQSVNVK